MQLVLMVRDGGVSGLLDVGGIELVRRAVRAAKLAGATRCLLVGAGAEVLARRFAGDVVLGDACELEAVATLEEASARVEGRFLVGEGSWLWTLGAAKQLAGLPSGRAAGLYTGSGALFAAALEPMHWSALVEAGGDVAGSVGAIDGLMRVEAADLNLMEVRDAASAREAKARMIRTLRKPFGRNADGLTAYYLNRPISMSVSRLLIHTPITPNQVTFLNLILALVGAGMIAMATPLWVALGAVVIQLVSIFDGIDGEIARMKLMMSARGELYDTIGDDVNRGTFFLALGWACYQQTPHVGFAAGTLLGMAMLIPAWFVLYAEMARKGVSSLNNAEWGFEREGGRISGSLRKFLVGFSYLLKRDSYILIFVLFMLIGQPQVSFALMLLGISFVFGGVVAERWATWQDARAAGAGERQIGAM
jgi:phosphatidylglycerophosphate synthase